LRIARDEPLRDGSIAVRTEAAKSLVVATCRRLRRALSTAARGVSERAAQKHVTFAA
jgi:hypothetical protein